MIRTVRKANKQERAKREKERKKLDREGQRIDRYRRWRELWMQGIPVADMAGILGLKPGSVAVRIARLRSEFGWFPRRRNPSTPGDNSKDVA